MNKVLVLNNVSPEGLKLFGDSYIVGKDVVGPEAIIVRSAVVDTDKYPGLLAVARAGAETKDISVVKATEKGICVFNTPGANANAVAEVVFYMIGLHIRHILPALEFVKALKGTDEEIHNAVEKGKSKFTGSELAGKTLGVIGLGKIGVLVANYGIDKRMKVVGYDAFPTLDNMHQLDRRVEIAPRMEAVLAAADILSVHVPLKETTTHLIGASQIALMKAGCILMNYARGPICDSTAVLKALDEHKLDIYITDFVTNELRAHNQVICTPHLGAGTDESEEKCAVMAVSQLRNYFEYGMVVNSVNFPALEMALSQGTVTRLAIVNKDVPNMISAITGVLGGAGVNILALDNKGRDGKIGYNLIDVGVEIGEDLISKIRQIPNVLQVRALKPV